MKYVLLTNIASEWIGKHSERSTQIRAKSEELGITMESVWYTQGAYDAVAVIDSPDAESALAISMWYADKGFGHIQTLPAYDSETMEKAAAKL